MTQYRTRLDAGEYTRAATKEAVVCAECGATFSSAHGLKIHTTKAHSPDTPPDDVAPESSE